MSSGPFGPGPQQRPRGCAVRLVPIIIGLIAIGYFIFQGCEEGPFGRKQLVGMELKDEMRLGAQAFAQVLQESEVDRDPRINDAVGRVAQNLIRASKNPSFNQMVKIPPREFDWNLRVVRNAQINAFCLPGGKIVVYTGILPVSGTETGLSVVMGHEIAHALARHGSERMGQNRLVQIGQMAAAGSISDLDPQAQRQIMMAFGLGARYGFQLPFSRSHESEADRVGLYLMAFAGYDPAEAPKFWVRMQEASKGGQPPEFMSTHPGHDTRIQDLQEWQTEVRPLYNASQKQPDGNRPLPIQ